MFFVKLCTRRSIFFSQRKKKSKEHTNTNTGSSMNVTEDYSKSTEVDPPPEMENEMNVSEDYSEFAEVDPSGRYGRYNEILGKGSSKTVYKAFDEYGGIEVAWNQVRLCDFLQTPDDLERLYCEIHLLKTLKHENIMKFFTSWVDTENRNINFVTEMFTSGSLREYRLKHKRVNIRAVKHWCRQILKGLLYLHSQDPPVIHRDLKCDNIFVNGNQGEVKIGDLGLAAILRKTHADHCVGTPEFMAPEVYLEEYNELVDIYSFGMCILEIVTFEYPYSECTHPAQIYKKVISGKKPKSLYKVKDFEVRQFVEKCLAAVSCRLSARELLLDPFLQIDDYGFDLRPVDYYNDYNDAGPFLLQPFSSLESPVSEWNLFNCREDENFGDVEIGIEGRREEEDILLRLRILDKEGSVHNIYFSFDIETDTALSVAAEMISELDMTDQDVTKIADMIDSEIARLVPNWKKILGIEDNTTGNNTSDAAKTPHVHHSARQISCSSVHGRFEEILYTEFEEEDTTSSQKSYKFSNTDSYETRVKLDYENGFYGNELRQELRWLKAKCQKQLSELKMLPNSNDLERKKRKNDSSVPCLRSFSLKTEIGGRGGLNCKAMATEKVILEGVLVPKLLYRASSLPVDAVDF